MVDFVIFVNFLPVWLSFVRKHCNSLVLSWLYSFWTKSVPGYEFDNYHIDFFSGTKMSKQILPIVGSFHIYNQCMETKFWNYIWYLIFTLFIFWLENGIIWEDSTSYKKKSQIEIKISNVIKMKNIVRPFYEYQNRI